MLPVFLIVTDLSPGDPSWARAAAQGERVAETCAPILGFRPEIEIAHLAESPGLEGDGATGHDGGSSPQTPGSLAAALSGHAARGRTLAFVLPAILDLGIFQRQALAAITREAQRRAPALTVHYDDVDPCHRLLVQALVEALWELLAGSDLPPGRLGVLLVAAGNGDAEGRARTYQRMRLVWEQLAAARGEVAFIRHPRPSVPEALERCAASPLHWIAVPELFWPGEHLAYAELLFEDLRRAHPDLTAPRLARPVGESPRVDAWIAERLLSLFRAHSARRDARAPSLVHAPSARESAVIGPLAACTMDILPRPLGPDLAYGPGVIAEIAETEGLARLLAHFEVSAPWVFVKVTWHGYATGTYTDAATLDKLLSALPGKAILLEGHSTGRNTGGASWDWETEARAHRAWILDQEAEFLRRTGIAEVIARHGAQYVNVTEAHWDGACAPREEVLRILGEAGVTLRDADLAGFVPAVVISHLGAPFISLARFKGPTRLGLSNCFGLLPPPLRSGFHGPTIDHFARVACDVARLYGALLRPYGLVEALHSAVRWGRDGLYRSRFGNYDIVHAPGIVTLSHGLVGADVLASRLQGQDVRRSAFFAAVFEELGAPEDAITGPIQEELVQRFV